MTTSYAPLSQTDIPPIEMLASNHLDTRTCVEPIQARDEYNTGFIRNLDVFLLCLGLVCFPLLFLLIFNNCCNFFPMRRSVFVAAIVLAVVESVMLLLGAFLLSLVVEVLGLLETISWLWGIITMF